MRIDYKLSTNGLVIENSKEIKVENENDIKKFALFVQVSIQEDAKYLARVHKANSAGH